MPSVNCSTDGTEWSIFTPHNLNNTTQRVRGTCSASKQGAAIWNKRGWLDFGIVNCYIFGLSSRYVALHACFHRSAKVRLQLESSFLHGL